MAAKKIKFDDCMTTVANNSNKEMLELLDRFEKGIIPPVPNPAKSVEETLIQMENDLTNIRCCLENKTKKLSLKDIDKKLDTILQILANRYDCWQILPESTTPSFSG